MAGLMHEAKFRDLDETQARQLLRDGSFVGHLGFIEDGRPMIIPVNYLADDDAIFLLTNEGHVISRMVGEIVAFEVDEFRALEEQGWNVLIHGMMRRVEDPEEVKRLARGPLHSWAWHHPARWVRIDIADISGRILTGGEPD